MRSYLLDKGLVVRCQDYKEADKLITLLTEKHGLINVFSIGSRRPTSKKNPHLDLLNLVNFNVDERNGHLYLKQVESLELFLTLKKDLAKISLALSMLEVIVGLVPLSVEDSELFQSTVNFLRLLDSSKEESQDKKNSSRFSRYLLRHLGYPEKPPLKLESFSSYLESIMNKKIISKEMV